VSEAGAASASAARRERAWLFGLALGLRLLVVGFAASRFPPADDGTFYHAVAIRIARGAGYTWAWPDGAVTYAAHYPVGYPALLGLFYRLLGEQPLTAMLVNALVGALAVVGVHSLALRVASPGRARLAALAVALHPTLILYTAAVMTEAVAASGLVLLASYTLFVASTQRGLSWRLALGVGGGALVLIRPQLLPLLPFFGAVAISVPAGVSGWRELARRLRGAAEVLLVALACCAPWTLRNCAKMDGCVFVSANGGWNLLIGTLPEGKGSFAPIAGSTVPPACREVFGEVGKDRCFGHAGAERITAAPWGWLALAPQKLGQLFNHGAIASAYLQTSNPRLITDSTRRGIATIETLYSRLLLLGACAALLRAATGWQGRTLALIAAAFTLSPWGYAAQLVVLGALLAERPGPGRRPLQFLAAAVLGSCVVTHVVFFGAPRYALIWSPWLAWLLVLPGKLAGISPPLESFDSGEGGRG
jgi:4-amino-4-deoxy-L-arabinose transferase-like glycosyltransferase